MPIRLFICALRACANTLVHPITDRYKPIQALFDQRVNGARWLSNTHNVFLRGRPRVDNTACLTLVDYSWCCRQRAAYKKHATANRMNAVDSSATRCVLPRPIVTQRRQSICHVIGFASAAPRNHLGSGSKG
jgi:hypothetical protein